MTQRTDDQMGGHGRVDPVEIPVDSVKLRAMLRFIVRGNSHARWNVPRDDGSGGFDVFERADVEREIERVEATDAALQRAEEALRGRRACDCSEPDPVMQADGKFYCHRCSFQTGARPHLDLEDALRRVKAAEEARDAMQRRAQSAEDDWQCAEEARAQLEPYVQHKSSCDIWAHFRGSIQHGTIEQIAGPCSCGLAALVPARPPPETER